MRSLTPPHDRLAPPRLRKRPQEGPVDAPRRRRRRTASTAGTRGKISASGKHHVPAQCQRPGRCDGAGSGRRQTSPPRRARSLRIMRSRAPGQWAASTQGDARTSARSRPSLGIAGIAAAHQRRSAHALCELEMACGLPLATRRARATRSIWVTRRRAAARRGTLAAAAPGPAATPPSMDAVGTTVSVAHTSPAAIFLLS